MLNLAGIAFVIAVMFGVPLLHGALQLLVAYLVSTGKPDASGRPMYTVTRYTAR